MRPRVHVVTIDDAGDVDAEAAARFRELAHRTYYAGKHEDDLPPALDVDRFASVPMATPVGSLVELQPT